MMDYSIKKQTLDGLVGLAGKTDPKKTLEIVGGIEGYIPSVKEELLIQRATDDATCLSKVMYRYLLHYPPLSDSELRQTVEALPTEGRADVVKVALRKVNKMALGTTFATRRCVGKLEILMEEICSSAVYVAPKQCNRCCLPGGSSKPGAGAEHNARV